MREIPKGLSLPRPRPLISFTSMGDLLIMQILDSQGHLEKKVLGFLFWHIPMILNILK